MINLLQKEAIFRLHDRRGKNITEISKELGISRPTIRKALKEGASVIPRYSKRRHQPCLVLGDYHGIIDQWLEDDRNVNKKQRHTAKRIFDRLVEEYEFSGSYSAVRKYIGRKKREIGLGREVFLPIDHPAGQEAQVDWYEAFVIDRTVQKEIKIYFLSVCS